MHWCAYCRIGYERRWFFTNFCDKNSYIKFHKLNNNEIRFVVLDQEKLPFFIFHNILNTEKDRIGNLKRFAERVVVGWSRQIYYHDYVKNYVPVPNFTVCVHKLTMKYTFQWRLHEIATKLIINNEIDWELCNKILKILQTAALEILRIGLTTRYMGSIKHYAPLLMYLKLRKQLVHTSKNVFLTKESADSSVRAGAIIFLEFWATWMINSSAWVFWGVWEKFS